jgi:SOS response regulatory protein OraA/RecX
MLIITNIKASRIPNRVNLTFSDASYLPFFVDDVVKLSLQKNKSLDDEKLAQIRSTALLYLGREYALRQIAISPKTKKIISQKLKIYFLKTRNKYQHLSSIKFDSIISSIIEELSSKNLLKQSDFIKSFISKNHHKSVKQIKFLLQQRGVDTSNLILDDIDDIDSIKRILVKKKITQETVTDFKAKNKLYSSLFRQGFEISDIRSAIDDYLALQ